MSGSQGRCGALVLALALLLAGTFAAHAQTQTYEQALEKFTADSYGDTDAAVAGVAASGNPLAAQVVEAGFRVTIEAGGCASVTYEEDGSHVVSVRS